MRCYSHVAKGICITRIDLVVDGRCLCFLTPVPAKQMKHLPDGWYLSHPSCVATKAGNTLARSQKKSRLTPRVGTSRNQKQYRRQVARRGRWGSHALQARKIIVRRGVVNRQRRISVDTSIWTEGSAGLTSTALESTSSIGHSSRMIWSRAGLPMSGLGYAMNERLTTEVRTPRIRALINCSFGTQAAGKSSGDCGRQGPGDDDEPVRLDSITGQAAARLAQGSGAKSHHHVVEFLVAELALCHRMSAVGEKRKAAST